MSLKILAPAPATFSGSGASIGNLGTPSPREVWNAGAATFGHCYVDLGAARTIDSVFAGSWIGATDASIDIFTTTGPTNEGSVNIVATRPLSHPGATNVSRNAFVPIAPTVSRYWWLRFRSTGTLTVGRVILGQAFERATSLGGGRQLVDPSRRTAFADGGFGIDRATVKRVVRWRFEDLDDAAVATLEAIGEDRGTSRPLVVVEHGADPVPALAIHYGLFNAFEAHERADPRETKWAFSLEEWR